MLKWTAPLMVAALSCPAVAAPPLPLDPHALQLLVACDNAFAYNLYVSFQLPSARTCHDPSLKLTQYGGMWEASTVQLNTTLTSSITNLASSGTPGSARISVRAPSGHWISSVFLNNEKSGYLRYIVPGQTGDLPTATVDRTTIEILFSCGQALEQLGFDFGDWRSVQPAVTTCTDRRLALKNQFGRGSALLGPVKLMTEVGISVGDDGRTVAYRLNVQSASGRWFSYYTGSDEVFTHITPVIREGRLPF